MRWRYYLDGRIKREIQSNGAYWQTTYDDVNRITTRIFYSAAGVPTATNSTQLDRRGNVDPARGRGRQRVHHCL